jgi:hypothetical protein
LLARAHHTLVYGQPGKTSLVAIEAEDDDKHLGGGA